MVGAVEQAALRLAVGRHAAALRGGVGGHHVLEARLALADQDHVARRAGALQRVEGEVRDHRLGRIERVLRIIFGAEQAALLGRPGGEEQGAVGARAADEVARDLQHAGETERVVMRAVADRVAIRVGRADAISVPMAAEHDRLVRPAAAGQAGDDVVAFDPHGR